MQPLDNPSHLQFEAGFWYDCANTYNEERKQHVYAQYMGLKPDKGWPYGYKASGSILDIGGGPVSLLLKTTGYRSAKVQDPTNYPSWVYQRYIDHGIAISRTPGERMIGDLESLSWITPAQYDEVWVYNCLQHTEDPKRILDNVVAYLTPKGRVFRFFEWTNIPPHEGHPHMITDSMFDEIRSMGKVQPDPVAHISSGHIDREGCFGSFIAGWVKL